MQRLTVASLLWSCWKTAVLRHVSENRLGVNNVRRRSFGWVHAPLSRENLATAVSDGSLGAILCGTSNWVSPTYRVLFPSFALPQWPTPLNLPPSVPKLHLQLFTASNLRLASHYLNMTKMSVMVHWKLWCILSWEAWEERSTKRKKKKNSWTTRAGHDFSGTVDQEGNVGWCSHDRMCSEVQPPSYLLKA